MATQLVRRLLWLPVVVWAVSTFTFFALRIVPGDVATTMALQALTPAQIADLRAQWGLDQPLHAQYGAFLGELVRADLGTSFTQGKTVRALLAERMPPTIELTLVALAFSVVLGVGAGLVSALCRNRWPDYLCRFVAVLGFSVPWFWLALMLIAVFSVGLRLTPVTGQLDPSIRLPRVTNFIIIDSLLAGNWRALGDYALHLILPTVAIGLSVAGFIARITRSAMLEVLRQDYVRVARSKGLHDRLVVLRHVLRNTLLPIVTFIGLMFGSLLGGAVVTETVFAWPGVGKMLVDAIFKRDFPVVQGTVIVIGAMYVIINLLIDMLYVYIDPRLRA
ncbi:MAG: ABC transporter permease [Chloroflexales bacterium]|nr:ABC transporter permease [Chloroflexales bacterium]